MPKAPTIKRQKATSEPSSKRKRDESGSAEQDDEGFVFTRKKTMATVTTTKTKSASKSGNSVKDKITSEKKRQTSKESGLSDDAAMADDQAGHRSTAAAPAPSALPTRKSSKPKLTPFEFEVPVATHESPVIKKNRAMRNPDAPSSSLSSDSSRRRSSFALRGKRVSSANNGLCTLPHEDIPTSELYRHISPELPDPLRMKQLLMWVAERSMLNGNYDLVKGLDKESKRTFKQAQLDFLKGLKNGKIATSWYHRPADVEEVPLITKPHPMNIKNEQTLKKYQESISSLSAEKSQWESYLTEYTSKLNRYLSHPPQKLENNLAVIDQESKEFLEKGMALMENVSSPEEWRQKLDDMKMALHNTSSALYRVSQFSKLTNDYAEKLEEDMGRVYEEMKESQPKISPMEVLKALARAS